MKNNKKGFTLLELLGAIVIIGILMVMAIPSISRQVDNSRKKVFYTSVYNIVSNIKTEVISGEKSGCIYNYDYDYEHQTPAISSLNVWVHKDDDGKYIYSVLAKRLDTSEESDIDVYDFSKTDFNTKSWKGPEINSYSANFISDPSVDAFLRLISGSEDVDIESLDDSFSECIVGNINSEVE